MGKSQVDDLNKEPGIVSGRVAVLLRFAEVNPEFKRFYNNKYVIIRVLRGWVFISD